MRVKLTLRQSQDRATDLLVTVDATASVGDVARALFAADPSHQGAIVPAGLTIHVASSGGGRTLDPQVNVLDAGLASGSTVTVVRRSEQYATATEGQGRTVAVLRVLAGPDRGREFALPAGSTVVGRDTDAQVRLADPLVSRHHMRINAGAAVEVLDLNSANGVIIGGSRVTRTAVTSEDVVQVGDTELCIVPTSGLGEGEGAEVHVTRSPAPLDVYIAPEVRAPEPPERPKPERFPLIAMVAPLVMGVVLFAFTRSMMSVIFVALSPLLMVGTWIDSVITGRRKFKVATKQFEEGVDSLARRLEEEQERERTALVAAHPPTEVVVEHALRLGSQLWTRRPEHRQFLTVRLGLGSRTSGVVVTMPTVNNTTPELWAALEQVVTQRARIDDVPVLAELRVCGSVGVAGAGPDTLRSAASLVVQLAAQHSPAEVVLTALIPAARRPDWDWLAWLPHTSSPHSPVDGSHLASDPTAGTALVSRLEELVEMRLDGQEPGPRGRVDEAPAEVEEPVVPTVVLLVEEGAPVERARLSRLTERGPDVGVHLIWVAPHVSRLPAGCRSYIDLRQGERAAVVGDVRAGSRAEGVVAEMTDASEAERFARAQAPLVDAEVPVEDESDLPRRVSYLALAGPELAESHSAVLERWQQSGSMELPDGGFPKRKTDSGLRGLVGHAGSEPLFLDLRTQGPHALVGGTTGAGKSEFLQSWVLGLASAYSPRRLTFLFVDYKGGSAFAECTQLPHNVGLVTDLSPHMVRRALTSLRAELHYREHILNRTKAKDLLAMERRGDAEAPPALVIVVDEFAALKTDVPEFVDGVIDVAQRGRSLGLHLILATQRPAGVITDNLRANTNLRVALRMNDADDSTDVLGVPLAAEFDPSIPGRGAVRTGPGRVTPFQTGYAGGRTTDEVPVPRIEAAGLGFGSAMTWEVPEPDSGPQQDSGPTDIARMVDTINRAAGHAQLPAPRRPWLDVLAPAYRLDKIPQRTDAALALGVQDAPKEQEQPHVYFYPDTDGNIGIYGTGGAGKSSTLRTLAASAAIYPRGGPVHVYGLDFGSRGLAMIEEMPHVGAIITGDDQERVGRLLRWLQQLITERAARYAAAQADSITAYRDAADAPMEPRILLLVDGIAAFRDAYDVGVSNNLFAGFEQIAADGRPVGVHVALTADRPSAVPPTVRSTVQRRLVLRLADDSDYSMLDVPGDVLGPGSPPGRGLIDGLETQIAVMGGSQNVANQAKAFRSLAITNRSRAPIGTVRDIQRLPEDIPITGVPALLGGQPVIGVESDELEPWAVRAEGAFLVSGPPGSGRSTALAAVRAAVERGLPTMRRVYLGQARSPLYLASGWHLRGGTPAEVRDVAEKLRAGLEDLGSEATGPMLVIVEDLPGLMASEAEVSLDDVLPVLADHGHFVVAEAELSKLSQTYGALAQYLKGSRRGLILQPEQNDGDSVLRTEFPRVSRGDFPPGRGLVADRGKVFRIQVVRP